MFALQPRVGMRSNVVPRPAIKAAFAHVGDVVGNQFVAKGVALVDRAPQLAGLRTDGDPHRVANAGSIDAHSGTIRIKGKNVGTVLFFGMRVRIVSVGTRTYGDEHGLSIGRELDIARPVPATGRQIGDVLGSAAGLQVAVVITKAHDRIG